LSDERVIRLVSEQFVPVAVDRLTIRDAKGPGGDLYRSIQKQNYQFQGVWIVSPKGEVLAAHHDFEDSKKWTAEILATIEKTPPEFKSDAPRRAERADPLAHRGVGCRDDGGATLAVSLREMRGQRPIGPGVIDSISFSADDFSSLAPERPEQGLTWELPDHIARAFCRVLSPSPDLNTTPTPDEVTSVSLKGKVEAVKGDLAEIVYSGTVAGSHKHPYKKDVGPSHGEATLTGVGKYDVRAGRLVSLLMLFRGKYRHFPPYDMPREVGAVVEWRQ
jgi:hypothetical protein